MKNVFLFLFTVWVGHVFSQDIITTRTGEEISAKVLEIGVDEIKYQKADQSPTYVVRKSEVFMIKYPDGRKDVFSDTPKVSAVASGPEPIKDMYYRGVNDANQYYKGQNSGSVGTLLTTSLVSPVFGLIPAISCASTTPNIHNLNMPDQSLSINQEYLKGYQTAAHGIKKKAVWTGFGVGVAVNLALIFLITSASR